MPNVIRIILIGIVVSWCMSSNNSLQVIFEWASFTSVLVYVFMINQSCYCYLLFSTLPCLWLFVRQFEFVVILDVPVLIHEPLGLVIINFWVGLASLDMGIIDYCTHLFMCHSHTSGGLHGKSLLRLSWLSMYWFGLE